MPRIATVWQRLVGSTGHSVVPLVSATIVGFLLAILFLLHNYNLFLQLQEEVLIKKELESKKMLLISEMMEVARSRTRLTSKIIDTEDPFEQDALNIELENGAGRFANLRRELLEMPLSADERNILSHNDSIVPIILPAQRSVVEMATNHDLDDDKKAKEILYEVVLPGQGELIRHLGMLISLAQRRIAELTSQSLDAFTAMKHRNYRLFSGILIITVVLSMIIILRIRAIQKALQTSAANLEQANLNLEEKVRDRTEQLNRLNKKLKQASEHDELTGLYNRRKYNSYIEYEYSRTRRQGSCFALIMADIDYFKPYNDHYGHQQGDECIRSVAQVLSECLPRSIDFAARYGGEEFVIILPHTDSEGAQTVAEHIRQAVVGLGLPHKYSKVASHVTVSLGIAIYRAQDSANIKQIVETADKCLYAAKAQGRNQVVTSIEN